MIEDLLVSNRRKLLYKALDRIALLVADRVIAVSEQGLRRLTQASGRVSRKVQLIRNGVDLGRFGNVHDVDRAELGLRVDSVVIGCCAQLTPAKRWHDFVEVLRKLDAAGCNVQGLIVGDGPLRDEIRSQVRDAGLTSTVVFAGHLSNVEYALTCMDIFLFLSEREGLSVAILEAMASALPVIATNVAGAPEQVIPNENGFLVDVGDIGAAVNAVLALYDDQSLRLRFGENSRSLAEAKYSIASMVGAYADAYRAVANGRRMHRSGEM